ncbi:MAG: DMT family transporter [Patescibacteria group bacterium]
MWLLLAIIGYFILALVVILDKLIVSKSAQKPIVYTFYSTIFMFGALLALPFVGWGVLHGVDWLWAIGSGVAFGLALWLLYLGIKEGETSHISPFNGAIFTAGIFIFANLLLQEKLSAVQIAGTIVLGFACLLLSFERSKKHKGIHIGFLWAGISGILFAFSHVAAKELYIVYPFWTAFIWTRATTGLVGLFCLLFPSVWQALRHHTEAKSYARKHAGSIIVLDKVLSVVAVILIQYAYATGVVTVVGAIGGLQYVFMFVMVYLLTKFLPRIFKEYFTKRELTVEVIATILVAIGSAFFVL